MTYSVMYADIEMDIVMSYLIIVACLTISSLSSTKKNRKRSSLKGKKLKMSWKAKSARAVLAAKTRAENRAKEAGIRGESKKILLVLDEKLLSDFDKWRKVANDLTVTGGIRRAMQQYIDHQKMVNR